MTLLLKDAFLPNLVQTLEGGPAFVHCGPFANIAHGCNSVMATELALRLADVVVTEAGFGADLGAEKFLDIKCRSRRFCSRGRGGGGHSAGAQAERRSFQGPAEGVRRRGGRARTSQPQRHLENVAKFGVPAVVALNRFITDGDGNSKQFGRAVPD